MVTVFWMKPFDPIPNVDRRIYRLVLVCEEQENRDSHQLIIFGTGRVC
jgi:hypothetical protein